MKFLVIQLRQLGDILLTTPVTATLRENYPRAEIIFLTHPMGKLVLNNNPDISEHWTYSDGAKEFLELIKKIRGKKFDWCFDFLCNPRSALIALCSGAKQKVGFQSARGWAYNNLVKRNIKCPPTYIVDEKLSYLVQAGLVINTIKRDLVLKYTAEDTVSYNQFKLAHPEYEKSSLRIVISPTHRRPARLWAKENFASLADYLTEKWGANILWIWGPGEQNYIEECRGLCKSGKGFMLPKTSFLEMAVFITHADFMVSGSNGPSHIAPSVGTSSLQLHGPTWGSAWCINEGPHFYLQGYVGPSQILAPNMSSLSVEEVIKTLETKKDLILHHKKQRPSELSKEC